MHKHINYVFYYQNKIHKKIFKISFRSAFASKKESIMFSNAIPKKGDIIKHKV